MSKKQVLITLPVVFLILCGAIGLYIRNYSECREFEHSVIYCLTRK
jgi:hypothetical protein